MNSLIVTFFVTLIISSLLTIPVRNLARRCGIVDYPDGKRKLHGGPVALWGGVAVCLALVLGLLAAGWGFFGADQKFRELAAVLIAAAGIVCLCGAIDDWRCLNPRFKLLLQVGSVLPIVAFGYWIDRVVAFGYPIEFGWLGIPITVAWLVGCINALNLLDGMDGLASLVGLLTATMMGIIAHSMGNDHVAVIAVVLVASLSGFLVHNLPPATIFLGDSGSMVIGLVLGVLGMQGAMKTSATLAITIPAVVMSLPIFDTVLALVRRKLTGRRFDAADRQHIHHRLLDRGFTQWQTLCLLGSLCLATGGAATAATIFRSDALAWITALTLLTLAVRLRLFGNHELMLAKRALARGLAALAQRLNCPGMVHRVPSRTRLAQVPLHEAWAILLAEAKNWNVRRLEVKLTCDGELRRRHGWGSPLGPPDEPLQWSITLSLGQRGGRLCEISAAGPDSAESPWVSFTGLTLLLKTFGSYFAEHWEQASSLAAMAETRAVPLADPPPQSKAA